MDAYFASLPVAPPSVVARMVARARVELDAHLRSLPSAEEEDAECRAFIEWAEGTAARAPAKKGKKAKPLVKRTEGETAAFGDVRATVLDFSPNSPAGDDALYAEHREVWEMLPRGCAIVRIEGGGRPTRHMWAARANRKFTGHEDEGGASAALYSVGDDGDAERKGEDAYELVTVKENGKVLHIAARRVSEDLVLLVIGSKKVHVVVPWRGGAAAAAGLGAAVREAYGEGMRYVLVARMADALGDALGDGRLVEFLARARLVVNAELLEPGGEHPVSNRALHGLDRVAPHAFSLTCQALRPPRGLELCVPPLLGLELLREHGLPAVRHALVPAGEAADAARAAVAGLPECEGAVVYHLRGPAGVAARLEKCKAANYVIRRAVREKVKSLLGGRASRRHGPGALVLLREAHEAAAAAAWRDGGRLELPFLSEAAGDRLRALGGRPESPSRWAFPPAAATPAALEEARAAYVAGRVASLRAGPLARGQDAVERRVREIDHVVVSDRERWVRLARGFFAWAFDRAAASPELADAAALVSRFSDRWAEFADGEAANKSD